MKRRNNPPTSNEAWYSVKDTSMLSDHHKKILNALDELKQGISEEIAVKCNMEKAQVYRRMDELEKLGLVREIGVRKTSSGRNAALYERVPPKKVVATSDCVQSSLFV